MSAVAQYRLLLDEETEEVSALARRVFDEFSAPDHPMEGHAEFHRYASSAALRERHRSGYLTFVAVRDGQIVGMLHLREPDHLAMLFVERSNQRRGIGRNLIRAVASSPTAVGAYQCLGFQAVGGEEVSKGIHFVPMELRIGSE
jgi:predicted N-acetyltransferase YhbS